VKLKRYGIMAGLALTATVALSACGSDNNAPATNTSSASKVDCVSGKLAAAGSSAQKNAMDEWIKAYQLQCSGATIEYNPSGSGAGITAFAGGTVDFAGSDSALKDGDEQTRADARCRTGKAINLPMVTGPIAVVFNLDGVKELKLKPATIAKIFAGTAPTWDDAAIKADNPGVTLPSTPILAVHRSDSSGTTDNFTKFLAATAGSDWTYANDKAWKAPGGQGQQGSDGVADAVKKTAGTIGYVEWSFATNKSLNIAKVGNGAGEFATLTADSASKTVAGAPVTGTGNDLKLKIDYNTKEAGAYPVVLVTYEIVCEKGTPADKLPLLKSFLKYTVGADGQASLTSLGYAPLPASLRGKVESAINSLA